MEDIEAGFKFYFFPTIESIFQKHIEGLKAVEVSNAEIEKLGGFEIFAEEVQLNARVSRFISHVYEVIDEEMSRSYGSGWLIFKKMKMHGKSLSRLSNFQSQMGDFVNAKLGWTPGSLHIIFQFLSQIDRECDLNEIFDIFEEEIDFRGLIELYKGADNQITRVWDGDQSHFVYPNPYIKEFVGLLPAILQETDRVVEYIDYLVNEYLKAALIITDDIEQAIDSDPEITQAEASEDNGKVAKNLIRPVFNEEIREDVISRLGEYFTPRNEFANFVNGDPINCKIDFNGVQAKLAGIFVQLRRDRDIDTGFHIETYEFIKNTFTYKGKNIVTKEIFNCLKDPSRINEKNMLRI